jgi:hypothetical protein
MKTTIFTFLFLLLIGTANNHSQSHPLLASDHIPLIGFANTAYVPSNWENFDYIKFKEMGLKGLIVDFESGMEVNQIMYDKFQNINDQVKLLPYMGWGGINFIQKYTNAIYTKWEAADTANSSIKAALEFDSSIAQRYNSNEIITDSGAAAGRLIWGPGYRQRINYMVDIAPIVYSAKFKLKITSHSNPPNPTDNVCAVKVMFKKIVDKIVVDSMYSPETILKVSDFTLGEWNETTIEYRLDTLDLNYLFRDEMKVPNQETEPSFARFVEFVVDWYGPENVILHFDNVTVSDIRGVELTGNVPNTRNQIIDQANNIYNNQPLFNESLVNFEHTVAGWYGLDEPETIDHLEPIRIIRELLDSATNGKRPLFISASGEGN